MKWEDSWITLKEQLQTTSESELRTFAKGCEEDIFGQESDWFCPNHPLDIVLYTFFTGNELKNLSEIGLHKVYYELARRAAEQEEYSESEKFCKAALVYNPVDLDSLFQLAVSYRQQEKYEEMKEIAFQIHPFCYMSPDLAWFYRLLGSYYLQKMEPQLAKNLYDYSNLLFPSVSADQEIAYLQKAMKNSLKDLSVVDMQQSLKQENIPLGANDITLGFVYKIAKQAIEAGNISYGRQLLVFLYEMTGDEEIRNELGLE